MGLDGRASFRELRAVLVAEKFQEADDFMKSN
jgi:hypothetical protein